MTSIPYMADEDGSIRDGIEALRVTGLIDESPVGRVRALDASSHAVYEEMYQVLTGEAGVTDPVEYETRLHDLAGQLSDLHARAERADAEAFAARWWSGGGARWVS